MSVESRIKKIVAENLSVSEDEVIPAANFVDDLGADSLDLVELMMALEEGFDMEIPDKEAEGLKTVQDALNYINSKC